MYNNYIPLFEFSVVETLLSIFIILLSVVIFIAISLKYRNNYHEGLLVFSLHSIWSVIFLVLSQYYGFQILQVGTRTLMIIRFWRISKRYFSISSLFS